MGMLDPEFTGIANSAPFEYDYPEYNAPAISADTRSAWFDFALDAGDKVVNYQTQIEASRNATPISSGGGGGGGFLGGGIDYTTIALIFGGLFLLSRIV